MSASVIPPPIVQSTYAPPPRPPVQSVLLERSAPLQDHQSELEADLQYLLDAQAEGLLKGLEGGSHDDSASTGSTTPTARSVRSASSRHGARPVKKKLGLRSARKGLYNTMLSLSAVKDDELHDISDNLREKDERIEQIDEWERKKAGLEDAARAVDSNEDTIRAQRLREQAETVEVEIRELERQLEDRRAAHRKLMRQATAVENEVQAKMASYTNSLRMLEEDVRKFLSINPQDSSSDPLHGEGRQSVWQLPPKRRTLELARDQYTTDRTSTMEHRSAVEREKDALEEGATIWKDVVAAVTEFERRMRDDMRNDHAPEEATERLQELLREMETLIGMLEGKLEGVRHKGWNLLVAAIGAEVDALQKGKELLENVLGVERSKEENGEADLIGTQTVPSTGHDDEDRESRSPSGGGEEIHGLDKSFETARRRRVSNGVDSSEDDPDPELLFSQHEVDA